MTTRTKIIIVVVYTAAAIAVGRYSTPEKIKVEVRTVEVEKKTDDKKTDAKANTHKKTTVVEIDKPSGEKDITMTITDDNSIETSIDNKETDVLDKTTDQSKEVVRGDSKVTISAMGGYDVTLNRVVYGASITKPVLGPFTVGVWGLTEPVFGASIGIEF